MIEYNLLDVADKKYEIKRILKKSSLKSEFDVSLLKQLTHSDTILQKNDFLYCCVLIEDANIIEEIFENIS